MVLFERIYLSRNFNSDLQQFIFSDGKIRPQFEIRFYETVKKIDLFITIIRIRLLKKIEYQLRRLCINYR
jgi:hypothetical protein